MIRSLLYVCLIYNIFNINNCEPLHGEKVLASNPYELPFIASLGVQNLNNSIERQHFCTGSLISEKHVLTAAHCLDDEIPSGVDLVIGDVKYEVNSWITYDHWAQVNGKNIVHSLNDIAIVELSSSVHQQGITPVTFTNLNDQQLYDSKAIIVGWKSSGEYPRLLHKAKVTIMRPKKCEEYLSAVSNMEVELDKYFLCASAEPYVLVDCGDSGGPLLNKDYEIVGVLHGSCPKQQRNDFPREVLKRLMVNLYTSVNYYMQFIQDVVNAGV